MPATATRWSRPKKYPQLLRNPTPLFMASGLCHQKLVSAKSFSMNWGPPIHLNPPVASPPTLRVQSPITSARLPLSVEIGAVTHRFKRRAHNLSTVPDIAYTTCQVAVRCLGSAANPYFCHYKLYNLTHRPFRVTQPLNEVLVVLGITESRRRLLPGTTTSPTIQTTTT